MGDYEIINLKGLKFKGLNGVYAELTGGFGLYETNQKGFVRFIDPIYKQLLVKIPYSNTKKVLQEIIDAGGLINFSEVEFINAINFSRE